MYEQKLEEKGDGSRLTARSNKILRNVLSEEIPPRQTLGRETRLVSTLMLPGEVGERSGQMIEIVWSVCRRKLWMKRFDLRAVRLSRGRSDRERKMRKEVENLEERLWEESAEAPSDLKTVNVKDARGGEKRETGVTRCQIKKGSKDTLIPKLLSQQR